MCACAAAYSSHTRRTQLKDRLNTGPDLGEYGTDASSSIMRIVFTVKYLGTFTFNKRFFSSVAGDFISGTVEKQEWEDYQGKLKLEQVTHSYFSYFPTLR